MKSLLLASAIAGALGLFAAPAFAHGDSYDRGYGDPYDQHGRYGDSYYQHGGYDYGYGERDGRHRYFRRGWDRHRERNWSYRHGDDSWRGWHRHDWRSYD